MTTIRSWNKNLGSKGRCFTLLEIVVCLAVLGLASTVVGVQIRQMVAEHTFRGNVAGFLAELKKCQLIAACDQTDIDVVIAKEGKHFSFWIETDDDLPFFSKKKMLMTGVHRVEKGGRAIKRDVIHFFPSGRFDARKLVLIHAGNVRYEVDMEHPLMIEGRS